MKHADKGDVPVKKYVTKKKMAEAPLGGIQRVSLNLAQYGGAEYLGTTWIGFAYYDDWGDEVIYWFPYDMVYDPYTGPSSTFPSKSLLLAGRRFRFAGAAPVVVLRPANAPVAVLLVDHPVALGDLPRARRIVARVRRTPDDGKGDQQEKGSTHR